VSKEKKIDCAIYHLSFEVVGPFKSNREVIAFGKQIVDHGIEGTTRSIKLIRQRIHTQEMQDLGLEITRG
jgi:hypothetical protein